MNKDNNSIPEMTAQEQAILEVQGKSGFLIAARNRLESAMLHFLPAGDGNTYFGDLRNKLLTERRPEQLTMLPDLFDLLAPSLTTERTMPGQTEEIIQAVENMFGGNLPAVPDPFPGVMPQYDPRYNDIQNHLHIAQLQGTLPKAIHTLVQREIQKQFLARREGFIDISQSAMLFNYTGDAAAEAIEIESRDVYGMDCVMKFSQNEIINYIFTTSRSLFRIDAFSGELFRNQHRKPLSLHNSYMQVDLTCIVDSIGIMYPNVAAVLRNAPDAIGMAATYGYLDFGKTGSYNFSGHRHSFSHIAFKALVAFYAVIIAAEDANTKPRGTFMALKPGEKGIALYSDGVGGIFTDLIESKNGAKQEPEVAKVHKDETPTTERSANFAKSLTGLTPTKAKAPKAVQPKRKPAVKKT